MRVLLIFFATPNGTKKTTGTRAFFENVTFEPHKTENHQKAPLNLDTQHINNEVRSSTTIRRAVRSLVEMYEKMLEYERKDSNDQFFEKQPLIFTFY